jgi:hypothetical protein
MTSCFDILHAISARSGLDRTAGHPLYSYRVTPQELDLLRDELIAIFNSRGSLRMAEECGAFCLFGAEWFRRNYRSGPWSWDVIFDALDLSGSRRPNTQVTTAEYGKRGLKYWNVRLLSTQLMNLYLRTVVCQGGFPINTLSNDGTGLSRLLKACLRDHERFPTEPMDEVLSRYIHFVPPTLQIGEVRKLAGDLIQAIARLRKQSDDALTRGLTRAAFLDQTAKGWEVELPLRVEEPEEKEILLSLLDAAKAEPFSRHALSVSTALLCDNKEAVIVRTLRCPSSLTEEEFRLVCKIEATKEILPRMTGYLQAGDQRTPVVSISRSNDGSGFRLTKYAVTTLSGSQAFFETALILAVGGEEIQRVPLPGGEALPESPWIFTADDLHQLIGVGSAKPRDNSVWIALPPICDVQQSTDSELKELDVSVAGRKVVELTGEVRIVCDDVQYRVSTKSDSNRDCLFELRGRSKRLGTGGSQVWCGHPSVWQIPLNENEVPSEVPREQLQWKPGTGGSWSGNFSKCLGFVQIRVLQEGDTRYLAKAIVMPPNIELQVVPGSKPGTGVLRISGLGTCKLAVERDERIQTSATRKDGVVLLEVNVVGERPGLITVRISFENDNSCDVSIVCPTTAFSLINVLGQPVDYPNGIPVDNLDGLTVQVIYPEQRIPLLYWPEGSLLIDRLRETNIPGVFEYPLSYITGYATELLACSDEPDGKVKFGIGTNVAFAPRFALSVGRYSHALDRPIPVAQVDGDEETTEICIKGLAATSSKLCEDCSLNIVPLGSPNDQMPADSITLKEVGRWIIRHSDYPAGYYLVIAKDSRGNSYRPLRIVVKASELKGNTDDVDDSRPAFWSVMNTHEKSRRLEAWDVYFKSMADNPAHPDWAQLDDFVNSSETLPVTTFEAVAAITRNHLAAARYGIIYPYRERLWRRFEQLPFLWSAIPIHAWLVTAARCWTFAHSRMTENGIDTEQVDILLGQVRDRFVEEAPNRSPHMASVILAMFASNRFGIPFSERLHMLDRRFTLDIRTREHTRLISHHDRFDTRSTWPNFPIECTQDAKDHLRSAGLMFETSKEEGFKNQWGVLNGPGIAAVKAVYGDGLHSKEITEYKRLRALDPEWYDIANAVAMKILLERRCNSDRNYLSDIMESLSK